MAFHIVVTDEDDGTILTDVESDGAVITYSSTEGINGETFMDCDGVSALRLAICLEQLRENILSRDPFLRLMYNLKTETIKETVEIDIGAIKRTMNKQEDGENDR